MNQALDNAIGDLLKDDKEFTYAISTDNAVFKQFGLSTFTSGQLYQFLQTDSTLSIPDVNFPPNVPSCTIGNPATQQSYPDKASCVAAGGTWLNFVPGQLLPHNAEGVLEHILTPMWDLPGWYDTPNSLPTAGLARGAEFIRYDILSTEDILEQLVDRKINPTDPVSYEWGSRYSGLSTPNMVLETDDGWIQTGNSLKAVIGMNDENIAGLLESVTGEAPDIATAKISKRQFLHDLTTSMSGCVRWSVPMGFNFGGQCTPNQVVDFKLYVFDKSQSSNGDRRIALRGSPLIVGVPTTAHGIPFAGGVPSTDSQKGQYPPVEFGGDTNPNNITTGELATSYNPNTGKFEAGTSQILARLLTDVAAVAMNKLDGGALADELTEGDISPTGNYALGNFTVGEAMPMGVHNGNPYDFGPFFVGDKCNQNTKHKIMVVNRCPKPFPKGQIVMCSKIDNEWIIMDFGYKDTDENFFETGNWRFCSMIANKDAYFRDERHTYDVMDTMADDGGKSFPGTITEQKYEYAFRWKWWSEISSTIAGKKTSTGRWPLQNENVTGTTTRSVLGTTRSNWDDANKPNTAVNALRAPVVGINGVTKDNGKMKDNPQVYGSRRYHQVSSFDFMHAGGGGFRQMPYLRKCNPMLDIDGSKPENLEKQTAASFFPMFGPIFTDGFDKDQVAQLDVDPLAKRGMSYGDEDGGLAYFSGGGSTRSPLINPVLIPDVSSSSNVAATSSLKSSSFTMFPADDPLLSQLPADVGHNAKPYSDDGSPLEDQNRILGNCNVVTSRTYSTELKGFFIETTAYVGDQSPSLLDGVANMFGDVRDSNGSSHTQSQRHQRRWQWQGKESLGAQTFTPSTSQSAWGLKPNNANRITFMPLTLEHLTSFDYTIGTGNYASNICTMDPILEGEPYRAFLNMFNHYPFAGCTPPTSYGEFDAAYKILNGQDPGGFMRNKTPALTTVDHNRYLWPTWSIERNYQYREDYLAGKPPEDPNGDPRGHDYCTLAANYPMRSMGLDDAGMAAITQSVNGGYRRLVADHLCISCQSGPPDEFGNIPSTVICGQPDPNDFIPLAQRLPGNQGGYDVPCKDLCTQLNTQPITKPGQCCKYPSRGSLNVGGFQEICEQQSVIGSIFAGTMCKRNGRLTGPEGALWSKCMIEHEAALNAKCAANVNIQPNGPNGTYVPPWNRPCEDPAAQAAFAAMADSDLMEPPKLPNWGFPYGVYTRDQHDYGNFPNDPHPDGTDGMETVGIITGKTTIRVGGFEIGVMTNNYVGLPRIQAISAALSSAVGNWGVKSEAIDSMGTTAIFAKTYTSWPDEQTLFDPRYFAVMHFNPGQLFTPPSGVDKGNPLNPVLEPYIWVDAIETEVDYRIPTLYGSLDGDVSKDAFNDPPEAPLGVLVYHEQDDPNEIASVIKSKKETRIRPDLADWKVATHRRGQLLPYSYFEKTIGLPWNASAYYMAGSGMGYKAGDLFESTGGQGKGATMVVTKVNEVEDDGPVGAIMDFSLGIFTSIKMNWNGTPNANFPKGFDRTKYMGRDYSPRDFVSKADEAKILDPTLGVVTSPPKITFKPKTRLDGKESEGFGALIYALYGIVYSHSAHDYGPKKQQSTTRVSATSQNGLAGSLDGREYSARLSLAEPTKDGYYDVFIHFHNDISHTTANAYDTRYTLGYQQFVNLELRGV